MSATRFAHLQPPAPLQLATITQHALRASEENHPELGALDGRSGTNRLPMDNALGAQNDLQAVRQFLAEYRESPQTLRAYTKEIERLLLWSWSCAQKPLSSLDRQDFAAYGAFLADPQPAAQWCGPRRGRSGKRGEPGWRPFVGPLTPQAQRSALVILHSLLSYLVRAQYLRHNPLALMRRRRGLGASVEVPVSERIASRALDDVEWRALTATLGDAALDARWGERVRVRYIVALLYFLALRVGELTTHTMGHFRQVRGLWFFFVVGKGNKPARLPVPDALLEELKGFRRAHGLIATPAPHETLPLVWREGGQTALGARRIAQLLCELGNFVAERLQDSPHRATHVREISPHWFRHTALTHQAQRGTPLAHLRANARHSRLDTTMLYVHAEEDLRHKEMRYQGWTHTPAAADLNPDNHVAGQV